MRIYFSGSLPGVALGVEDASITTYSNASAAIRYELSARSDGELARVVAHIGKGVRDFFQFRRRRFTEGDHFYLTPFIHIEILNERDKVAIAGGEDNGVELRCELHRVNCKPDVPVGFLRAVGEDLEVFHLGLDTDFRKCFEEIFSSPVSVEMT